MDNSIEIIAAITNKAKQIPIKIAGIPINIIPTVDSSLLFFFSSLKYFLFILSHKYEIIIR